MFSPGIWWSGSSVNRFRSVVDALQMDTFCHWAWGSSGLCSLARGMLLFVIGAMAVT